MKKAIVFPALLFLLWVASSCQSGSSPLGPNSGEIIEANGLKMTVSTSGQGTGLLTFVIELKNGGSRTIALEFSDGQAFDIAISDSRGDIIWTWSHGKAFPQYVWELVLKPGDVDSRRADWDLKTNDGTQVPPGVYKAIVWITSSPRDAAPSVEFSLTI